ncbi:MAG TPA: CDGSH iron-sulfur domain-containing protein [Verrucomicrobiae bacterium]|nr:CDGSH iron-sulfur domain-containing protein [Verrucomicrobiae bacterium]
MFALHLCRCGQSNHKPFRDGSHAGLKIHDLARQKGTEGTIARL